MAEIILFPDTPQSIAAEVDEDLVRRDVADCLEGTELGAVLGKHASLVGSMVSQLLVERASEWITGYVFASDAQPSLDHQP